MRWPLIGSLWSQLSIPIYLIIFVIVSREFGSNIVPFLGIHYLQSFPYRLLHALQDHPDMKLEDWKLIIVDEYQDLNQCDLSVLKEITRWNQCILAVGDDDQSIYSFRLAHPIGIQRFLGDYPGAIDYTLSVSQRCGSLITRWANHVIEGLPNRPERPALTPASHCSLGTIRYLRFDNWNQEIKGVARIVSWIIESKRIKPKKLSFYSVQIIIIPGLNRL